MTTSRSTTLGSWDSPLITAFDRWLVVPAGGKRKGKVERPFGYVESSLLGPAGPSGPWST